jgi:apolipoprotein D and lipocalin family protein
MIKFILYFSLIFFAHSDDLPDLPVVSSFSLPSYMGHWYLYSAIPQIHDFFCVCPQTIYEIDSKNSSIINFDEYCHVGFAWAPVLHSKSYGIVSDNPAKWINVNTIIGNWTVDADYYIIEVSADYGFAAVGARNRKSLYFLSRNKVVDENLYNGFLELARRLGFDVQKVKKSNQECEEGSTLISKRFISQ